MTIKSKCNINIKKYNMYWNDKIREKLVIWLYIGTKMACKGEKLLKNILSLTKKNDKKITTGFYDQKYRHKSRI